jgi:hypothetical protein
MGWRISDQEELGILMRFLLRVCKQEKLAHVWLATSDYSFTGWLASGK